MKSRKELIQELKSIVSYSDLELANMTDNEIASAIRVCRELKAKALSRNFLESSENNSPTFLQESSV